MTTLRSRSMLLALGITTLIGGVLVACTGDDAAGVISGNPDAAVDGADTSTPTPPGDDKDGATPGDEDAQADKDADTEPGDASDVDGGDTDGGDTDGGDTDAGSDVDAGTDAGPVECNALKPTAPAVTSTCSTLAVTQTGGALTGGTYYLKAVELAPNFGCGKFAVSDYVGALQLSVDKDTGVGTANIVIVNVKAKTEIRQTRTYTPGKGNASPLLSKGVCPAGGDAKQPYTATGGLQSGYTLTIEDAANLKVGTFTYTWHRNGIIKPPIDPLPITP